MFKVGEILVVSESCYYEIIYADTEKVTAWVLRKTVTGIYRTEQGVTFSNDCKKYDSDFQIKRATNLEVKDLDWQPLKNIVILGNWII